MPNLYILALALLLRDTIINILEYMGNKLNKIYNEPAALLLIAIVKIFMNPPSWFIYPSIAVMLILLSCVKLPPAIIAGNILTVAFIVKS